MESRLTHMDVAKGIGIILVVLAHSWLSLHKKGELFIVLGSFVVQLFFLLSGVFLKTDVPLLKYSLKRAESLLKPYLVTLIGVAFVYSILKGESLTTNILGALYGTGTTVRWVPVWFIPHLFVLSIFSLVLLRLTNLEKRTWVTKVFFLLLIIALGTQFLDTFWMLPVVINGEHVSFFERQLVLPGLPFSVDILLVTSFFFLSGYLIRGWLKAFKVNSFLLAVSVLSFVAIHFLTDYSVDINMRIYEHPIISTISALLGIYIAISVSKILSGYTLMTRVFSYIGYRSLFVLLFHSVFQGKAFALWNMLFDDYKAIGSMICVIPGVIFPLILAEIITRSDVLKIFYYPVISEKVSQKTHYIPKNPTAICSGVKPHCTT